MKKSLLSLLRSRKFLLALAAVIQTVVMNYYNVSEDVWQSINLLIGSVIAGIAIEDAAAKYSG